MENKDNYNSISKKNFISILIMLFVLLLLSVVLTYILPKGEFGHFEDGTPNYSEVIEIKNAGGIPVLKGLFAPVLVFFSRDGRNLIVLSVFILAVNASFYLMNEVGGIRSIVGLIVNRFGKRQGVLLTVMSFLFFCFGSFLGLFEEVLVLLPIVCSVCLLAGFDSFTGFLCCIVSCGFGFAAAITNPFTVIPASELIGVSPMENIGFRFVIFATMFVLLQCFIQYYTRQLKKDRSRSMTYEHDRNLLKNNVQAGADAITEGMPAAGERTEKDKAADRKRIRAYAAFFAGLIILVPVSSLVPVLRGIGVGVLTLYSLIFGILTALYVSDSKKEIPKKTLQGFVTGLPAIVVIALSGSIKYVFEEGNIMPVMISRLNRLTEDQNPLANAFFIFLIVLVLEFFISSSTAKAVFVMGVLALMNPGIGKGMCVLLYLFGDGYTNVFFPTSPVLLIALSMIGVEYFKWMKKSFPLLLCTFALLAVFIAVGVFCGF